MSSTNLDSILERQLLLQLGDRLKHLRKAQGIGTVEMASRVGVTRTTLRAVEAGDPATSIGTYLRVMSALGVGGDFALLAGDTLQSPPPNSAAARSRRAAPVVRVHVTAASGKHVVQDLQSIALHEEAIRMVKADPSLRDKAEETVNRWLETGDPRSAPLWREWLGILESGSWRKVLGRTRHAQQLRQASPLVTVLPKKQRDAILEAVRQLKSGVVLEGPSGNATAGGTHDTRRA